MTGKTLTSLVLRRRDQTESTCRKVLHGYGSHAVTYILIYCKVLHSYNLKTDLLALDARSV